MQEFLNLFLFFEDVLLIQYWLQFSFVQLFVKQITCQDGYVALCSNLAR